MTFCLLPAKVEEFKKALKDKELNMAELLNMTTEARTKIFEKYAGDSAKAVNTLFEEKLVLKNRMQGLKNWASKVGEFGRYDPARKAKLDALISEYRAQQQERIFSPKEHQAFLKDLVEEKFGTRISKEESKNIFDLTSKADGLKAKFNEKTGKWPSEKDRLDYGAAKVALNNYTDHLKGSELPIKGQIQERLREFKTTAETNKTRAVFDLSKDALAKISDNSVALVASLDNSFLGRQGLKTLMTHPSVWWDGAKNSFVDIAKTLGGQETMDALMADIYSKPNYLNGSYEKAGILPKNEEQFPTSLPERIWGLGKVFKASEAAFKGSAVRMRTGLYDLVSGLAKDNGLDMADKKNIADIGKLINSLTARGQWGKYGESPIVKLVMWSPRMLKANIDVLTGHGLGSGLDTPFARKQAGKNLLKIVMSTAAIMAIANAIKPGSAETDPHSSNFGKIKVGNTTFDISGGAGSLVTLAARMLPFVGGYTKSSTTGAITQYGSGYGQTSKFDALIDFLSNKSTPAAHVIIDMLKGKNAIGQPVTLGGEIYGAFTPIPVQNFINLKDGVSVDKVAGAIADAVGISSSVSDPVGNKLQSGIDTAQAKLDALDPKAVASVQSIYDQAKKAGFGSPKADSLVADLSESDYNIYKDLKALDSAKNVATLAEKVQPLVEQAYAAGFGSDKADAIVAKLSDDEYAAYQKIKLALYGKDSTGKPSLEGEQTDKGILGTIGTYASAIGTDPITAFDRIFSGQRIVRTENGAVIVERMPLADSTAAKKSLGGGKDMTLDHWIPLELGGSNDISNLKLVPADEAKKADVVENYLGKQLKSGAMNKDQVQKTMLDFKNGKITAAQAMGGSNNTNYDTAYKDPREMNSYQIMPKESGIELTNQDSAPTRIANAISKNVPFFETPDGKTMRQAVFNNYPFTTQAQNTLNKNSKVSFDTGKLDSSGLKASDAIGTQITSKLSTPEFLYNLFTGRNTGSKETIDIGMNATPVVAHELFHAAFSQNDVNPAQFNKAWDSYRSQNPGSTTMSGLSTSSPSDALMKIDEHITRDYNLSGISRSEADFHWATERFAYLGQLRGVGGLNAIPAPLQPFYSQVLSNKNMAAKK